MKLTKRVLTQIVLGSVLITLTGCFSSSMMSTAKTLDKSEEQFSLGASAYLIEKSEIGAAPDLLYRRGINDKLDFGLAYSMGVLGHVRGDVKYELLSWGNEKNFLSTGFGMDLYLPDDFGDSKMIGSTIPIYLSLNHHKSVVPYMAQRFTFGWNGLKTFGYQRATDKISNFTSISHKMYYSGALGLRFGQDRMKYFLEFSYSYGQEDYFGAWSSSAEPGEWINISESNKKMNLQVTLGITFGPTRK